MVPNGERRFPATFDYGVNGESRAHEDTVSDTAPYTSDLFPVELFRSVCACAIYGLLVGAWRGFIVYRVFSWGKPLPASFISEDSYEGVIQIPTQLNGRGDQKLFSPFVQANKSWIRPCVYIYMSDLSVCVLALLSWC